MVAAELDGEWCRSILRAFANQQIVLGGSNPNLRNKVARSAEFFRKLDRSFSAKRDITHSTLALTFSSKELRRYLLASRFVVEALSLENFGDQRAQVLEEKRIADILERVEAKSCRAILESYLGWLRKSGTSIRTARLYLRAAEAFCLCGHWGGLRAWDDSQIASFLTDSPGLAASLGRFVTYCRDELGWNVSIPKKPASDDSGKRSTRQVHRLSRILKELDCQPLEACTTKQLARLFSLAFDVPAALLMRLRSSIQVHEDGISIEIMDSAIIDVSHPLYRYAQRWADLSEKYRLRGS